MLRPGAKHLVTDIKQVFDLTPRKLEDVPTIKRQFEWVDYAQRKLGSELPMWTMDMQSPFSVAAQIVEPTELMMACVTNPKAVHHICRMVTDFTLTLMTKHLEQMEHPGYPGANFPTISENIGLCLADDTPLIMLSPAMYEEFALPYNSELGEALGGIHLHSCGDYRHNLDSVLKIRNIQSIQLHAGPGEFQLPESTEEDCAFNRARKAGGAVCGYQPCGAERQVQRQVQGALWGVCFAEAEGWGHAGLYIAELRRSKSGGSKGSIGLDAGTSVREFWG